MLRKFAGVIEPLKSQIVMTIDSAKEL